MREILFKAKRLDNGKWVKGVPVDVTPLACFSSDTVKKEVVMVRAGFADWGMPRSLEGAKVDPETVCQFTGLTDKNGKKIFEGDLLKSPSLINNDDTSPVFFKWNCGCCYGVYGFSCDCFDFSEHAIGMSEVVGNIHDKEETSNE